MLRCLTVWVAAGLLPLGLCQLLAPELLDLLRAGPQTPFADLLVAASAAALVGCSSWFWLVMTVALATSLTGRRTQWVGAPRWLRCLVALLCGLAVIGLPAAAHADPTAGRPPGAPDSPALEGMAVPDLPTTAAPTPGPRAARTARPARSGRVVVVARGDTLWAIARDEAPADAGDAAIDRAWRRIWRLNRDEVGPDPDLIHPGQRLELGEQQ